jgi:hypothetical protein
MTVASLRLLRGARLWASALVLFAACSAPRVEPSRAPLPLDPLLPGLVDRPRRAAEAELGELVRLAAEDRPLLFERALERSRATALAALLRGRLSPADQRHLARAWDRAHGGELAEELVRVRLEHREAHDAYQARRVELLDALERGDLRAAREDLPLAAPEGAAASALLGAEARALTGYGRVRMGEAARGAADFAAAARALPAGLGQERARLWLLEAQALAEAGDGLRAAEAWQAAIDGALSAGAPVDAAFWERAAVARPAPGDWSAAVLEVARRRFAPGPADAEPEALVGGWIGQQWLLEGHGEAALLGFLRAAGEAQSPVLRSAAQVGSARALLALGRPGEATALLSVAGGQEDPAAAAPALALLGAVELSLARPERARALLERALYDEPEALWMGRNDAQANLGLALLQTGEDEAGLEQLRLAAARFRLEGDLEGLRRCWSNELRQAEATHDSARIERLETQLANLGRP